MNRFTYIFPIVGFGVLGFLGSSIASLPLLWINTIIAFVTILVFGQMIVKWSDPKITWTDFFVSASQAFAEFAVNFLLLAYHIGTSAPLLAAVVGVLGGMTLFAFLWLTLLISVQDSNK